MVGKVDLASNWEFFRQQWKGYEVATELSLQTTYGGPISFFEVGNGHIMSLNSQKFDPLPEQQNTERVRMFI